MNAKEANAGEKSKVHKVPLTVEEQLDDMIPAKRNYENIRDCSCPEGSEEKCVDILCPRK